MVHMTWWGDMSNEEIQDSRAVGDGSGGFHLSQR